jgi:hypothetical protein
MIKGRSLSLLIQPSLEADRKHKKIRNWEPPQSGKIKVNVDGTFVEV